MRPPFVTLGIAALTGAVYAWLASRPDAEFLRAVEIRAASPLLHASLSHLLVNLALLLAFGPSIEKRAKGWGLALVYVLSAAAGVGAHQLASGLPLVGASGAVSGVIGAHAGVRPWGKASVVAAALWGVANAAGWLVWPGAGLSYASHLGGLVAGGVVAALIASRGRKSRRGGP